MTQKIKNVFAQLLGALGGAKHKGCIEKKSELKKLTSAANGKLGGRPKKEKNEN